ncbi:MAG: HyaD/HybD family hydrogenase maturation endopeptidase [Nitrolancea sp.]
MMETVVIGLGNVILSDEGVGVHALRSVQETLDGVENLTFIDGGTLGLELLSVASGADRLLLLDAVDVGAPAGTLARFDRKQLSLLLSGSSAHELGVSDLLSALKMLGAEPQDIVLIGLQPEQTSLGTELTPAVAQALPGLVSAAVHEIRSWQMGSSAE